MPRQAASEYDKKRPDQRGRFLSYEMRRLLSVRITCFSHLLPAGTAARRASTTGPVMAPKTSPSQRSASPTTHPLPSRKREQQAPASPYDARSIAPLGRERHTSDAPLAGQPRAPGGSPPRSRAEGREGRDRARGRRAPGEAPGPWDAATTTSGRPPRSRTPGRRGASRRRSPACTRTPPADARRPRWRPRRRPRRRTRCGC